MAIALKKWVVLKDLIFKIHNLKKLSKDQLSLITMYKWMLCANIKKIQEVHKVYEGNILNNFVPMLGDLIMLKKNLGG